MFPEGRRSGGAPLLQAMDGRSVTAWLSDAGLDTVYLGIWDSSGTLRQKRLGAAAAARALEQGWSFIETIDWWAPDDATWSPHAGALHGTAHADAGSGRPHPFDPGAAVFAADFDDAPLAARSPRVQLQRMIQRAADLGIEVRVSWEFECIVLDQNAEELLAGGATTMRPALAANRCWSALTTAADADLLRDLTAALEAGGVPVDHTCAELGPGCLELAVGPEDALASADSAALAKLYTKAFFARRGQTATFMAQLDEGFPGLGGHPSLSLWSADGRPLLGETGGSLSKTALAAIAGITTLLPDLLVLAAHTVNAYRRYSPGNWAPRRATWGDGNYSCALRAVTDVEPEAVRLELRVPGADTSPHRCLAMMLGAALWGIEGALDAPDPVAAPADGRGSLQGAPLPRTLVEAAERFSGSAPARQLYGDTFVDHIVDAATAEEAACRRMVSPAERLRYLHQV